MAITIISIILGHIGLFLRLGVTSQDKTIGGMIAAIKTESGFALLSWLIYVSYLSFWIWTPWMSIVFDGMIDFIIPAAIIPTQMDFFPMGELNPLTILLGVFSDVNLFRLFVKTATDKAKSALKARGKSQDQPSNKP